MRLLDFFLALLVMEDELLVLHVKFLLFQLKDAILRHLSLNVATLLFASRPVLLHRSDKVFDILGVDFGVLTSLLSGVSLHLLLLLHNLQIWQLKLC